MKLNNNILYDFQSKTGFDLKGFFENTRIFFYSDFPKIATFFNGKSDSIDKNQIRKLNSLTEQSIVLTNIFHTKKKLFDDIDYWNLLDKIEDLKTKLQTSQNISKYLRSSIIGGSIRSGHVVDYVMDNQETLEDITRLIGEKDYNNGWVNTALENDLKEIDWDIDGGTKIKLRKKIFQSNLVTSMIDNTIGERIYGKDIKKLLTIEDNDLLVLGYKDTVFQTVDILSKLSKNDIPEFKYLGLNGELYKGANFSKLNYPSISRELKRNFNSDDLFENFEIKKMELKDGDLFVEFSIDTKYELVLIKNILI